MRYIVQPLSPRAAASPLYAGNDGRTFTISSLASGLALVDKGDGVGITQERWTGDALQHWRVISMGDGTHRIENVGSGRVLFVPNYSKVNGTIIGAETRHGGSNLRFQFTQQASGLFRIDVADSRMSIDLDGGRTNPGAKVQQWPWHGGPNQLWMLGLVDDAYRGSDVGAVVEIFEHPNFSGHSAKLGLGKWPVTDIALGTGDNTVSAIRVPQGVRAILFDSPDLTGTGYVVTGDIANLNQFDNRVSSVAVEPCATIYEHPNYGGRAATLGVGVYQNPRQFGLGNDSISSIRVPRGLMVTLYQHTFTGDYRTYFEDCPNLGSMNDQTSSIVVKAVGVRVPDHAIRFGAHIHLKSHINTYLQALPDSNVRGSGARPEYWEAFEILRAGPTTHRSLLSFGDVVSLKTAHGGPVTARADQTVGWRAGVVGPDEQWQVVRAGNSTHTSFVCVGDRIGLRSLTRNCYLVIEANQDGNVNRAALGPWETFSISQIPVETFRYGDWVQLRTAHGRWVGAEQSGVMKNVATRPQHWEVFQIVNPDDAASRSWVRDSGKVALRSFHNKLLAAEPNGVAIANRDGIGPWETFQLKRGGRQKHPAFISRGDEFAFLSTAHNRFLVAEADGSVNANGNAVGPSETFTLERIPDEAIRYGDQLVLLGTHGRWLTATGDGGLRADSDSVGAAQTFTLVRIVDHQVHTASNGRMVRWDVDTIGLRSSAGLYVVGEADGRANANRGAAATWEAWRFAAPGPTRHMSFLTSGDRMGLLNDTHRRYLSALLDGGTNNRPTWLQSWETFQIFKKDRIPTPAQQIAGNAVAALLATEQATANCSIAVCGVAAGQPIPASSFEVATCLQEACGTDQCGIDYCGADACGAAACGVAAGLIGVCGAAAAGVAICGVDVAGVGVCGAAACGGAIAGIGACGADACVAALCGVANCGAAGCGAAACGADACGAAACGVAAAPAAAALAAACGIDASATVDVHLVAVCAADAAIFDSCGVEVCLTNVCVIDACPVDACAADACAIDIIPIIPGI